MGIELPGKVCCSILNQIDTISLCRIRLLRAARFGCLCRISRAAHDAISYFSTRSLETVALIKFLRVIVTSGAQTVHTIIPDTHRKKVSHTKSTDITLPGRPPPVLYRFRSNVLYGSGHDNPRRSGCCPFPPLNSHSIALFFWPL